MKIILEGCDYSGKSTIVQKIKDTCANESIAIFHNGPYSNVVDGEELFDIYSEQLRSENKNIICDRSFFSELIYSEIYSNRVNRLNYHHIRRLLNIIIEKDFLILFIGRDVNLMPIDELLEKQPFIDKINSTVDMHQRITNVQNKYMNLYFRICDLYPSVNIKFTTMNKLLNDKDFIRGILL